MIQLVTLVFTSIVYTTMFVERLEYSRAKIDQYLERGAREFAIRWCGMMQAAEMNIEAAYDLLLAEGFIEPAELSRRYELIKKRMESMRESGLQSTQFSCSLFEDHLNVVYQHRPGRPEYWPNWIFKFDSTVD